VSIWRTDEWCFYTALSHVSTGELATAALQNTLLDDVAVVKTSVDNGGNLSPTAATTLTLSANANGSVTPTQNVHVIDTNAAASAGDLATLAIAGNIRSGHLLLLSAANVAHVVTVKNGTGNISIDGGDFVLDATTRFILLQLVGTTWFKVASSAVGVAGAFGFRLTLSSNAPVPAGDVTGATTLYAAPYGMFAGWCTGVRREWESDDRPEWPVLDCDSGDEREGVQRLRLPERHRTHVGVGDLDERLDARHGGL